MRTMGKKKYKGWVGSRFASCGIVIFVLAGMAVGQAAPGASASTAVAGSQNSAFTQTQQLVQKGEYEAAIAQLRQMEAEKPAVKGLAHELGSAYYAKGDYIAAIVALKRAREEDPQDKEAVQLTGLSYYLAGKPVEAIPYLEKVQSWYPRANVDAAYILGNCYIQAKQYEQARGAFARMFEVGKDSASSYLFTARMLMRQEFDPVAEEYALKAVAADAKLPLAHFLLGEIYLYKSRIPEAIAEFEKEMVLNPAHAPTLYKLADAYSRVQKFDDAERLLQRSIWLDATSTGPFILLGKVLEKKGEAALAIRALSHAATMDPNNAITHHLLGMAYRDLGKTEDAERELKRSQELQPGFDKR